MPKVSNIKKYSLAAVVGLGVFMAATKAKAVIWYIVILLALIVIIAAWRVNTEDWADVNKDILEEVEEIRKIRERERVLNKQTFMLRKEHLEKLRIEMANQYASQLFRMVTDQSMQLSNLHEMSATYGASGTAKNGELAVAPQYNSEKYKYFKKLLGAHYPLTGDRLSLARGGVDPEYLAIDIADMKKRFDDMLLNGSDGTEIYTKGDDDDKEKNDKKVYLDQELQQPINVFLLTLATDLQKQIKDLSSQYKEASYEN